MEDEDGSELDQDVESSHSDKDGSQIEGSEDDDLVGLDEILIYTFAEAHQVRLRQRRRPRCEHPIKQRVIRSIEAGTGLAVPETKA